LEFGYTLKDWVVGVVEDEASANEQPQPSRD